MTSMRIRIRDSATQTTTEKKKEKQRLKQSLGAMRNGKVFHLAADVATVFEARTRLDMELKGIGKYCK